MTDRNNFFRRAIEAGCRPFYGRDGRRGLHYPASCLSAHCGGGGSDCETCAFGPSLQAFRDWASATNAAPADEVWSPTIYIEQGG